MKRAAALLVAGLMSGWATGCGTDDITVIATRPQQVPETDLRDAGTPDPDAGMPAPDAGPPAPDAGVADPDAGVADPDAGVADPDAGVADPDAGVADPDAGVADPDAGVADPDAGVPDPGDPDAGPPAPDAGMGPLYPPILPECANHSGDAELCWEEWMKETGTVDFTPIGLGELGAGPWPVADVTELDDQVGIDERIVGVGVDTGQTQYAVSREALFIRRPGEQDFTKYPRNTAGLLDWPLRSVAGGRAGVAYVGYQGLFSDDPFVDPPEWKKSGDVQQLDLTTDGFNATSWDTHNTNNPVTGKNDHTRDIRQIVVPRRGPAAGEVYLCTEHAIVRYQGEQYADHRHIESVEEVTGSHRFGACQSLAVEANGNAWYGSTYAFGGLPWSPRLYEWLIVARWMFPTWAFDEATNRDNYEGIGLDSTGHHVWAAARGKGLAHMTINARRTGTTIETLAMPDLWANDLVVDLDDTVWIAGDGGLQRYDPASDNWTAYPAMGTGIIDLYLDDTVEPRALYAATKNGVRIYRGP